MSEKKNYFRKKKNPGIPKESLSDTTISVNMIESDLVVVDVEANLVGVKDNMDVLPQRYSLFIKSVVQEYLNTATRQSINLEMGKSKINNKIKKKRIQISNEIY